MIVFQIIGLLAVSALFGYLALLGLFCAIFNDIGGNGSHASALSFLLLFVLSVGFIIWLWATYSPFTIAVAS